MASKKFEKGSREFEWFGDFWTMVQRFWNQEDNDQYWENLTTYAEEFYQKYSQDGKLERFSKALTVAFIEFLEGEWKIDRQK